MRTCRISYPYHPLLVAAGRRSTGRIRAADVGVLRPRLGSAEKRLGVLCPARRRALTGTARKGRTCPRARPRLLCPCTARAPATCCLDRPGHVPRSTCKLHFPAPVFHICDALALASDDPQRAGPSPSCSFSRAGNNTRCTPSPRPSLARMRARCYGPGGRHGGVMTKLLAGIYSTLPVRLGTDDSARLQAEVTQTAGRAPERATSRTAGGGGSHLSRSYTVKQPARGPRRPGIGIGACAARRPLHIAPWRRPVPARLLTPRRAFVQPCSVRSSGAGNRSPSTRA